MSTYTIGEVAEASGFRASALRYYESVGLLTPAGRTASGYRVFDEAALTRLAFIARAKQLGCSLEEITDLVRVWDGTCEPVQRRFHRLVTSKLAETERRIAELQALHHQLEDAAVQLAGRALDGPCDGACACIRTSRKSA